MAETHRGRTAQWWAEACDTLHDSNNRLVHENAKSKRKLKKIKALADEADEHGHGFMSAAATIKILEE